MASRTYELQALLDVLLHAVHEAVTCIDRDGVVTHWNPVAERIYGIARQEIIGQHIGAFFQKGSAMLLHVMQTGQPIEQVYHQPRPDTHVLISALPLCAPDGTPLGAVAIEQDVSHNVRLSAERYHQPGQTASGWGLPFQTRNSAVQHVLHVLSLAVQQTVPLLLIGEAGVGKNLLARLLHEELQATGRHHGVFCEINCSTLSGGLIDTELFGFQIGVFGQAVSIAEARPGKLELAQGGTLFIKDVHKMPLATQEKLAQALREHQFHRVGDTLSRPLNCRIVASAGSGLQKRIERAEFSRELYYACQPLQIPALRERLEDLPELCRLYLAEIAERTGTLTPSLADEVLAALTAYHWPGNLPELRHVMEQAALLSAGREITLEHLPPAQRLATLTDFAPSPQPLAAVYEEIERAKIADALLRTAGNKASAARLLGISRGALYYKMKQYNI